MKIYNYTSIWWPTINVSYVNKYEIALVWNVEDVSDKIMKIQPAPVQIVRTNV
jgi:hypothetical protein